MIPFTEGKFEMNRKVLISLLLVFCLLFNIGCAPKEKEKEKKDNENEIIPHDLKDIDQTLLLLIDMLGGPKAQKKEDIKVELNKVASEEQDKSQDSAKKDESEEKEKEKENSDSESKSDGKEEDSSNKSNESDGEQKKSESPSKAPSDESMKGSSLLFSNNKGFLAFSKPETIMKLQGNTEVLHYLWNSFRNQCLKKNAPSEVVSNFSSTLNEFTIAINNKNETQALILASKLYESMPIFYSLYKKDATPNLKKMYSNMISSCVYSMQSNFETANSYAETIKTTWGDCKNMVEDGSSKDLVESSVIGVSEAAPQMNTPLLLVKAKILLGNINELEDKLSKMKKS